jgi:magnesium transporter
MLINCVAYQEGKKLKDISIEEISDYLAIPDCFVWVALMDAELAELEKMREEFDLHALAVEDAWHSHQRPKIEEYGDSLFAAMHLVKLEGDELTVGEVDVFVGINYVLSVRNRSSDGFLGVRARCEREPHLLSHGAGFVFYALMDAVVDRYFPILDEFETELENIEENIFIKKGSALSNIERLYELKRKVMMLKHAVAPLMEDTGKLYRGRVPQVCSNSQEYFRDVFDHLNHINASIDTIRDTIGTAIQVNLSMVTIEEGEVTKKLAAWAGIFAVATAFVGIWGMNFDVMPELRMRYGYPAALALISIICGILYRRFKKAGWL